MKNTLLYNILILIICYSCSSQDINALRVEEIVGRYHTVFNESPKNIPSQVSVDAPLLGNGYSAVAISGKPEKQIFHIARNDFWRLKSALDESFPAVLCNLELDLPSLTEAEYSITQSLYEAKTYATFKKDDYTVKYTAYVSAADDFLVVVVSMDGDGEVCGSAKLVAPGENEIFVNLPLERDFPDVSELISDNSGVTCFYRAFEDDVDIKTKAAVALNVINSDDGSFTITKDKPLVFIAAFSSNFKSSDCVKSVTSRVKEVTENEIDALDSNHKKWWKEYWEKSYVSIGDSLIERQYYLSLYGMGSCSRDRDFPPSIFGSWITRERPAWNGDYHLNYNHMAPYYGLYSSNRIEQATPYYVPLLAQIDRGRYYSEQVTGIKDGILLPVGAGPLGVETTRESQFMRDHYADWITSGNIEYGGMFWGQKSNSAYCVVNMSMQFYRTWDEEFTREVYPFVKGVALFWQDYLKKEDGRYSIYNDAIHEGSIGTKNPILTLGLIPMVMQTAIDMSELLNVDDDLRPRWKEVKQNISNFTTQQLEGKEVFRYSEKGAAWWGDNTLGIQAIYPAGQIGLGSDPYLLNVARNTIEVMGRWKDFNGTNSFFPAAVRVGYNPDTILTKLHAYIEHTYPNGFQLNNPHGIENLSTVPNTINEMLCMGHQDTLRLFPVWNNKKDASFYNIRVEGAFLVSSALKDGEVEYVDIKSEKGRDLTLKNPWGDISVDVFTEGENAVKLSGNTINLKTQKDGTYRFVKAEGL